MTARSYYGDTTLSESEVNCVVKERGHGVSDQGRQEDERDDYKGEAVVFLKLDGMLISSVHTQGKDLPTYGINA